MRLTHVTVLFDLIVLSALAACGGGATGPADQSGAGQPTAEQTPTLSIWQAPSAAIDPTALPLRDQAFVTGGAQMGYVYVCDAMAFQQPDGPGAAKQGDWIDAVHGTYDVTKKISVQGSVSYSDAAFSVTPSDALRAIQGNGLPLGVPTGTFPVQASDPAYQYDPNPNAVTAQTYNFSIPRNPTVNATPACTYKRVGITLDGVPLHLPFDSSGRNELAYELQDSDTGGPEPGGSYHRHALSDVTPHIHEPNALVGYALDGFGIFSPFDASGRELVSADLDACHGTTSEIMWEGQMVNMYHYVLTRDFPYSVACFRGTPTRNAFPALPGAPPETADGGTPSQPPPSGGSGPGTGPVTGPGSGPGPGSCTPPTGQPTTPPPPAAFTACQDLNAGAACTFTGDGGAQMTGACHGPPDNPTGTPLACIPCQ